MANEQDNRPWFEFRIEDTEGLGVEASKLSKLLQDLSSAFYAIARAKLGADATRRGRRTADEDILAAIRIVRVMPGSTVLEAEPPAAGLQTSLDLMASPTADDVAYDFALEAQRADRRQRSAFSRPEVRRRVQAVLRDASEIGQTTEVIVRPRGNKRPDFAQGDEMRVRLTALGAIKADERAIPVPRRRRLTGHVFMVDVEPGRLRVRLKLPDGRDLTLDAEPGLTNMLPTAVDRAVEIEAIEEFEGDQVTGRTAVDLLLLPSSGIGSDVPPKSIEELAAEQGLSNASPNYRALADAVWTTKEELAEFDEYLKQVRRPASA
jgi:hypothetical protein